MTHPKPTAGLHHVALNIIKLEQCVQFYTEIVGMEIDWQPDADNVYLSSGNDNFALHRSKAKEIDRQASALDHIGFILQQADDVDAWYEYLLQHNVTIVAKPKVHRDGCKSLYCSDPDGNVVQFIYVPSIVEKLA